MGHTMILLCSRTSVYKADRSLVKYEVPRHLCVDFYEFTAVTVKRRGKADVMTEQYALNAVEFEAPASIKFITLCGSWRQPNFSLINILLAI